MAFTGIDDFNRALGGGTDRDNDMGSLLPHTLGSESRLDESNASQTLLPLEDEAIFSVHPLEWTPDEEQGQVVSISCGMNVLVMGTSNCHFVRWDLESGRFDKIVISHKTSENVHKIFIDPSGNHTIVSMDSGRNFYIAKAQMKFKELSRFKNVVIDSIGWDQQNESETSTSRILIGSSTGLIFEAQIEDGKERHFEKVYDVNDDQKETSPICGLQVELFPASSDSVKKYFVMAATPHRVYQFIGGPSFDTMFAKYEEPSFQEVPGDLNYSELHFFRKYLRAKNCIWLTGAGIYFGSLVFGSQDGQPGDRVVDDDDLRSYPPLPDSPPTGAPPLSMALTEFHFLLLYPDRLIAINHLSSDVVFNEKFATPSCGRLIHITSDPTTHSVFIACENKVFEVLIEDEDRDVWSLFLQEGKFDTALEHATDPQQREVVLSKQADYYFTSGSFEIAASIYAKTRRSFEEVTLKFVNAGARNALKMYLMAKLKSLRLEDITQQLMIATWLTEIFLDKLNRASEQSDEKNDGESLFQIQDEFREFLDEYSDCLNARTTFDLISSHGRVDDLLYYAELIGDYEKVISHHLQYKQYGDALQVLADHSQPARVEDLYYKFCPMLMQHLPKETVDMLIKINALDPSKLIPALMRYEAKNLQGKDIDETNHAIRYLEFCIKGPKQNKDPAIHNYLISLYAKLPDEGALLEFIQSQDAHLGGKPVFDYKYALRLCHQEGKSRSCVSIYNAMELYEEAVNLALTIDLDLAIESVEKATATFEDENDEFVKKLWLIVARHIISVEKNIPKAMTIMKECPTQLRIEDILPYFPDFVQIGEFKDEICESLESYNKEIDELKERMAEYTQSAQLIRNDITKIRDRNGMVNANQKCDACLQPVLTRQFYLFPCTHAYHADCISAEVKQYLKKHPRVLSRKDHGSLYSLIAHEALESGKIKIPKPTEESKGEPEHKEGVLTFDLLPEDVIDQMSAAECISCGSMMLDMVQEPFIDFATEGKLIESWEI